MAGTSLQQGFLLGVNYWPAESGVNWWEEFSPRPVARDLALMQQMHLNCLRLFLRWQDFQPAPDRIGETAVAHLDQVLAMARRHNLKLIPTLFTGHMSGENWDVPWRQNRCPYSHPDLLRAQLYLTHYLARRYGRDQTIIAWDLANEHDNFAPLPDAPAGWLWAHLLTREFQLYARQPVLLGTHATSFTERRTFQLPDLGKLHDRVCVHAYSGYSNLCPGRPGTVPGTLFPSFCLKLARGLSGKPALLEEFGISTTMVDAGEARHHFQVVLFSTLAAGAAGSLAWCFSDSAVTGRPPYASTPYEIGFGMTRDGRLKEPGAALAAFAGPARQIPWDELSPAPARAAIMLPARYYNHPEEDHPPARHFATLFAAFVLAKQAGLEPEFIRPGADLGPYRLVICPSVPRRGNLDLPHWQQLEAFVRQGGCLYLSFAGVAFPGLEEVCGFGRFHPDLVSPAAIPGVDGPGRRLQVEPQTAKVISHGADGLPLALANRYGNGTAVFVTEPVEAYLAGTPYHLAQNSVHTIYRHAATAAGLDTGSWGAVDCRPVNLTGEDTGSATGTAPGEAKLFLPREGTAAAPCMVLVNHHTAAAIWPNPGGFPWQDVATGETFSGPVPVPAQEGRLLRCCSPITQLDPGLGASAP